jgi:hypothetical protein
MIVVARTSSSRSSIFEMPVNAVNRRSRSAACAA